MEIILAVLVGVLYAAGVYMLLRRSILKFIIGIMFIGNATNLIVFLASGIVAGEPAFVDGVVQNASEMADPLPQAFVLTSIVISFGIVVFALALKLKFFEITGTEDLDQLTKTDN
ncbi:MAG: NADH-quinone oxidoreductase subunit K [Dysgonamonadaceae bacterium]|jgi:multicomponent Na+:H+ antiporter subunit C|nr:NADH-quinone oxidoreductase subunit K [Dysgonamonadaceae bacterium]MDD3356051.1 NADH-quinone oxidoreductase subunit K [Dysgonamonadaceae bacterium]MDD3727772.1 NADH-quinone oxidoreductase subunit K [Dysgonamonadaceae bacterium]MDD4246455.1 NADH-quinone oxidoreductase subunit K [Dysgonamonadaceae bacterium]MDD4605322.1 NADH-quinone oxidoreductase subunit K [Dysgonamonadaceae bacterium]